MSTPSPACPRCAYDLSGATATWRNACPLDGRCPECGLDFPWRDVVLAHRLRTPGFVEHARGIVQRPWWAWRTFAWTLRPGVFWGRVGMRSRPRVGGMVAWLLLVFVPPFLISAATEAMIRFDDISRRTPWVRGRGSDLMEIMAPFAAPLMSYHYFYGPRPPRWPAFTTAAAAASLLFPLVLLTLNDTRRLAKVHPLHVVRAGVYGLAWVAALSTLWAAIWLVQGIGYAASGPNRLGGGPPRDWVELLARGLRRDFMIPLVLAWVFLWWWCAIRTLLTGHRPAWVFLACAVPAGLAAAIGVAVSVILRLTLR